MRSFYIAATFDDGFCARAVADNVESPTCAQVADLWQLLVTAAFAHGNRDAHRAQVEHGVRVSDAVVGWPGSTSYVPARVTFLESGALSE